MYKKYLTTMAAAQKLKIVIFLGSTREGRLGERVSKFVMNSLQEKYELTLFGKCIQQRVQGEFNKFVELGV